MARDDKHREQIRLAAQAKNEAIRRLITIHQAEFDEIYADEAARVGVTPRAVTAARKIERLKKEVARLEKDR
jgi:hypothetical protein